MKLNKRSGFTLLEIMLVVMIIALLAGSAIYLMGGNLNVAQSVRVKSDLQAITTHIEALPGAEWDPADDGAGAAGAGGAAGF